MDGEVRSVTVTSGSEGETERVGEALGRLLRAGDVVGLTGELGAGKTCLTRGIARGLGCLVPVTSPTFVLAQAYEGPVWLRHYDLYRIGHGSEVAGIGFVEYRDDSVSVVEWVEKAPISILGPHLVVALSILGERARGIEVRANGEEYGETVVKLGNSLSINK